IMYEFTTIPEHNNPPPRMDPEARQSQLLDIGRRVIIASSEHDPGVNLFEDLHWIDPGSELYLDSLIEMVAETKNLTVVNFRPEYQADWLAMPHVKRIDLVPLGPEAIDELLNDLLGTDASLKPV